MRSGQCTPPGGIAGTFVLAGGGRAGAHPAHGHSAERPCAQAGADPGGESEE
jgi:hypothetical protein